MYEDLYGPIGGQRLDYAAALIAERITNTNLSKGAKPAHVETFVPNWGGASLDG